MIARPHDGASPCGSLHELVGATPRPHVGLTPVRARLHCPLSRLEVRPPVAAVRPVSSVSQSCAQEHTSTRIARPHDGLALRQLARWYDRTMVSRLSGHASTVRSAGWRYGWRRPQCSRLAQRCSREHKSTRVR
eukprot:6485697-Prymnesium_polylepis.1